MRGPFRVRWTIGIIRRPQLVSWEQKQPQPRHEKTRLLPDGPQDRRTEPPAPLPSRGPCSLPVP